MFGQQVLFPLSRFDVKFSRFCSKFFDARLEGTNIFASARICEFFLNIFGQFKQIGNVDIISWEINYFGLFMDHESWLYYYMNKAD